MYIKSCITYTGPFKALDACPVCNEPCFNSQHRPRQVFLTIPVGLLLQALRRSKAKAMALRYRTLHTKALLSELANNEGFVTNPFLLWHALTMLFTSLFHLWSTCIVLKADMPSYTYIPHFYHMFYRCLPQGEPQSFTYLKPVVRRLYSLAFH